MPTLSETGSVSFSSDGTAYLVMGPRGVNQTWRVSRMVTTTDSTTETELRVYRNYAEAAYLIDGSKRANQDTNEITNQLTITSTERLVFVWTGGTPDKTARITLTGSINYGV